MYERQFHDWLKPHIKSSGDYLSRVRTIERCYSIDIDKEYDKDRCSWLLTQFVYSKEDSDNERKPKHIIPIEPLSEKDRFQSYYKGTNDYETSIRRYVDFRDALGDNVVDSDRPEKPLTEEDIYKGRRRQQRRDKSSSYKGNHIGRSQNLFIRNLLSNLGGNSISKEEVAETKAYFGGKCAYCGTANEEIDLDHAIPINKKKLGEHKLGNLVPACKKCNNEKGGQDYIEFCKDNIEAAQKIKDYMTSRNYVPLTDDEKTANSIRKILETAHKEIGSAADRYNALLNDLFFL